jgi:hypothetical protein
MSMASVACSRPGTESSGRSHRSERRIRVSDYLSRNGAVPEAVARDRNGLPNCMETGRDGRAIASHKGRSDGGADRRARGRMGISSQAGASRALAETPARR